MFIKIQHEAYAPHELAHRTIMRITIDLLSVPKELLSTRQKRHDIVLSAVKGICSPLRAAVEGKIKAEIVEIKYVE